MSALEPPPPTSDGNAREIETNSPPAAPVPGPSDHGDIPLKSGGRRTLGMRIPAKGKPFYFLANSSGSRQPLQATLPAHARRRGTGMV